MFFRQLLNDETAWPRLSDGYLAEWTAFGSLDRLRQAFALAEPLGALHQSVSYQRLAANTAGPTQQSMVGGVTYWVRRVLKTAPVAESD